MGSLFAGGVKLPPPPPPLPRLEDPELKRRKEQQRLARRRRRGFGATRLTAPGLGDTDPLIDRPRLATTLGGRVVG